jgi:formylglycine-generating enzyme
VISRRLRQPALAAVSFALAACAVSFDDYVLGEPDASAGSAGGAGRGGAAGSSGASGSGGASGRGGSGGASGEGGTFGGGGSGAAGGSAGTLGADGGGAGGTSGAGGSGAGGTSGGGGTGGTGAAGGSGGTTGTAGAGGTAGRGGTSGRSGTGGAGGAGGSAGSSGTSGSGGSGGTGGVPSCPVGLPGPPMLLVTKPGGSYCIDQTEVTNAHYGAFLTATPSSQIADCSWNTSFAPATSTNCAAPLPFDPVNRANYPVSCVDWCDAYAYCQTAGKRLCGALEGGGAVPLASAADASQSQWYRACSAAGTRRYPYGNQYQGSYCNGIDGTSPVTVAVSTLPLCQGGYVGIYDMSGNVREWENACSGSGQSGACAQRGGSYLDADDPPPATTLECSSAATASRDRRDRLLGFRCCLDL